jgi:hypothetical protein
MGRYSSCKNNILFITVNMEIPPEEGLLDAIAVSVV